MCDVREIKNQSIDKICYCHNNENNTPINMSNNIIIN